MPAKIFEVDGVIPDNFSVESLELTAYGVFDPVWNASIKARLDEKYGKFSLHDLPDKDVFEKSKKIVVLGGEKANICYDPKILSSKLYSQLAVYGADRKEQPSEVSKLAEEIVRTNEISEGDVIICPDHGLGSAIQMHVKIPDSVVYYDWHMDDCEDCMYTRSSWAGHFRNNFKALGFENQPNIIQTKSRLTENELRKINGKTMLSICLDVLNPKYADAVINLREDEGMELKDLLGEVGMLRKRKDITSLGICEGRRVLDDRGNTANTNREIVKEFI